MPSSRPCFRQRARASAYSWLSTPGPSSACSNSDCPKCRELDLGVLAVERDDVGERARAVAGAGGEVVPRGRCAELGQHHQQLVVPSRSPSIDVRSVASTIVAPSAASSCTARSACVVGVAAVAPVASLGARRSASRPAVRRRRARRSRSRSPASTPSSAAASRTVVAIGPGESCELETGTTPSVGTTPDGRLEPDAAVERRRAGDRAVRLRADRVRRDAGRDRGAAAGARAAGGPVQGVGVAGQAAVGAPPGGRVARRGCWPTR